jgi:hypothetical protein
MRSKITWALIIMVLFVCIATGCHTADRWAQCRVSPAAQVEVPA